MEEFTQDLFTYRAQAVESARMATRHLVGLLRDEGTDPIAAIANAIEWRAYARWWTSLTDHIEHDATDPATALATARANAHDALLNLPAPHHACPFTNAHTIAVTEATRRFFHDTATLTTTTPTPTPRPHTTRVHRPRPRSVLATDAGVGSGPGSAPP